MSGRGETPSKKEVTRRNGEPNPVTFGEPVYDDGDVLGEIRGPEEGGFFVTTREGIKGSSIDHVRSGHEFGEAEVVWRCIRCGQMEKLDRDLLARRSTTPSSISFRPTRSYRPPRSSPTTPATVVRR
ncbi:DUF7130 family rubredoxin-like protein (plasmid) [Haloferacaceae archaeon DSL9]